MSRITQIQEFLKESPDDNFLMHALALEFLKEGNEDAATACFEQNLSCNPSYVATYYHYGKLLEHTGKADAALEIYQRGMKIAETLDDRHAFSELRSVYDELAY